MTRDDKVALAERAVELLLQRKFAAREAYSAKEMAEAIVDAIEGTPPPVGQVQ